MLSGLSPGTTYYLQMVATSTDGNQTSQMIYDAGPVTTSAATAGDVWQWYRVTSITNDGPSGGTLAPSGSCGAYDNTSQPETLADLGVTDAQADVFGSTTTLQAGPTPTFLEDGSWVFASSLQDAIQRSLLGLVTDGSVPILDPSGNFQVWHYTYTWPTRR